MDELLEILLIANTPAFLFRRFRSAQAVQELARTHTSAQLAATIAAALNSQEKTHDVLAQGYAAAVALAEKPISEVREAMANLPLERSAWLADLVKMSAADRSANRVIETSIELPPPRLLGERSKVTSSDFTTALDLLRPKPKTLPSTPTSPSVTNVVRSENN